MRMLFLIWTVFYSILGTVAYGDTAATGGTRVIENPTSGGNLLFRVNDAGTKRDVLDVSSTGVWTIGPTVGAAGHTIRGGNTLVNVRSENASTSAYMTFAASGAGQSAIIGACSAASLIVDAAEGDMCLRTGNDIRFSTNSGGSSAGRVSGTVWYNATGNWTMASDKRLKKNIVTMEGALDRLNSLRPVTFDWIEDKPANRPRAGFIAQEVEQTFPGMVRTSEHTYTKNGKALTLKDAKHLDLGSEMFANLVQAIQELKAENDALRFRVTAIEGDK